MEAVARAICRAVQAPPDVLDQPGTTLIAADWRAPDA
jgi:hypothetical protein